MEVLFIHSAGRQDDETGSGPFLAALRTALGDEMRVAAPIMPTPDAPEAGPWDTALAGHIAAMQGRFLLLGHSLGGSTVLKHLAENGVPAQLAGVVCVAAPFWGMPEWEYPPFALPEGFAARLRAIPRLVFYQSRDDAVVDISHLHRYGAELPRAIVREVDGRGHEFVDVTVADIAEDIRAMAASTEV